MSKDSSAKYDQDNKERIQKKLIKDIKVIQKKKIKKITKWSQAMYKNLAEYEKWLIE